MADTCSWNPPSVSDGQVSQCWNTFRRDKRVIRDDNRVGLAIVIGITSHYGPKGVPADIERVMDTFAKLRFAVWKVENPNETKLEAILRAASTKRLPVSFKCIVVYYIGHGGSDSEGGSFIIPSLALPLHRPKGKPRYYIQKGIITKFAKSHLYHLFFFDCCLSFTVDGSQLSGDTDLPLPVIPKASKFLIVYATSQDATRASGFAGGGKWTQILMANIENYDMPVTAILDMTWEDLLKKESQTIAIRKPLYVSSVGTFSLRAASAASPVVSDPPQGYHFKDIEDKRPELHHLIAALKFMENDEATWKWFGELLDPDMKGSWPYGCTLEHFLEDVYERNPSLSWGDVRRAMRQPTADKKGYPLSVKVNGEKRNCEDLLLEHMSDDKLHFYAIGLDVSEVFRRHSADIIDAIAEIRIDEVVDQLHSASLLPKAVYTNVDTISVYKKATKVVRELQRRIDNSKDPIGCFNQTCQVLLKLDDKKLNGIVAKMTGTNETSPATNFEIIDQNNLEEAMKEGSVESHITKAVVQGEARAGKTSFKCLLLHQPYDELSTSCVEAPQIAFRTHNFSVSRFGRTSDGKHWKPVNEEEMFDMILAELRSITIESTFIPMKSTTVVHDSPELTPMPIPESTPELTSEPIPFELESPAETKAVHGFIPEVDELFEKCKNIHRKEGLSIHHDWLYFIDSGGQIQFQKLLPVFMPFASHLILVLNLANSLSCPSSTVMQLRDRQIKVGEHSLTVEEILKQLVSAIALSTEKFNTLITQDHILSKYIHPSVDKLNVIAVATHSDKYSSVVEKNEQVKKIEEMLNKICSSMKQKCKLVRGDTPQSHCDILYDVDGSKAKSGKFNDPVVEQIAEKLQSQAYKIDVPIKWYCFCVLLHKIAKEGCGVLSLSDCQALGMQLQIPKDEVASALKFFHILNMLLYYSDSPAVADMVFVQVDSLIDIIRDLVVLACSDDRRAEADVEELATQGFLSVRVLEMLEKYRKISNAFEKFGEKLLSLFEHLLIAVRLPDDEHTFFMPALLPVSEVKDINPEEPPPLLFYFENAVPMGLFCTTIVHLSKVSSWHIIGTENYSNYITLQNDDSLKEIILVERIDCIEVRAKHPDTQIARHIEEAIQVTIGHDRSAKKAFYCRLPACPFHGRRHVAVVVGQRNHVVHCKRSKRWYKLDEEMICWLGTDSVSTGSSSTIPPDNPEFTPEQGEPPKDIFQKTLPRLTSPLGKEPNFTNGTNLLLGEKLITQNVLDGITSQPNLTDSQRGSKVAHVLLDKIKASSDPVQCLLKICDVLEDDLVDDELKKYGAKMRSQLPFTYQSPVDPRAGLRERSKDRESDQTVSVVSKKQISSSSNTSSGSRSHKQRLKSRRYHSPSPVYERRRRSHSRSPDHYRSERKSSRKEHWSRSRSPSSSYRPHPSYRHRSSERERRRGGYSRSNSRSRSPLPRSRSSKRKERAIERNYSANPGPSLKRKKSKKSKKEKKHHKRSPPPSPSLSPKPRKVHTKKDNDELKLPQMEDVIQALRDSYFDTTKWRGVGLSLGLYDNTLRAIERGSSDFDERLEGCLRAWFERSDGVEDKGGATWSSLVKALRDNNLNAVAKRIERKYLSKS